MVSTINRVHVTKATPIISPDLTAIRVRRIFRTRKTPEPKQHRTKHTIGAGAWKNNSKKYLQYTFLRQTVLNKENLESPEKN